MLEERKAGKEDSEGCSGLSQAYPGLCWWFTVQVCLHEQSTWSDWGDDVEVRRPSVCVCVLPMRSCLWCRLALVPVKITWSTCSTFIEFLCHFYMKWIKSMFSKLMLLVILFILLTCELWIKISMEQIFMWNCDQFTLRSILSMCSCYLLRHFPCWELHKSLSW